MSKFEKGTVVITVDDGKRNAYRFYKEILEKYGVPATFNVVTDWIDTANNPDSSFLSIQQVKQMAKSELCELAAHSHTHKNSDEDIKMSEQLLREWLGLEEKIGFASPGSKMKNDFIKENEQKLSDMGFLYVRTGRTTAEPDQRHCLAIEKAKNMGLCDYAVEYSKQLIYGFDSMCVNSAIVLNYNSVDELKDLTKLAAEEKACILFMFHSIAKKGEYKPDDLWSYDFDKCEQFISYLSELKNQGKIELLTTKQAYLKGRE